ncbi:MAG TPA: PA domain-containing protein [Gaiellaceae bacterium]|nr:PA domain-containing protein [Gaiellaceae bacterium]
MRRISVVLVAITSATVLMLGGVGGALASTPPPALSGDDDFFTSHHQHGTSAGHLPGSSSNVDLVGKLKLVNFDGDISDVSALQASSDGKWYAYLGDWGEKCQTGGVHAVDISDPANPVKIGFLNAGGTAYQTEGVQALHIDTTDFTGDILVVSNEWCLAKSNPKLNPGGISIWDITDPTNPTRLVDGFGDFEVFGNRANESHSAIAWDAGDGDAYVAAIDNDETFDDVDIFEITDPRNPVKLSETGLFDWPAAESAAFGEFPTSHDLDVIKKGSEWHLMVSYWDTGWVDLDVTDPSTPTFVEDSTYASCDQVIQGDPDLGYCVQPEGNAHQGEWNADGSLFIGTDEDFGPSRANCSFDSTAIGCSEFPWAVPLATKFPSGFSGSVAFGGSGCPGFDLDGSGADDRAEVVADFSQADTGADAIAFVRGTCFFSEKVETGELAGYDMVIVINSHAGALNGLTPNAHFAGGQGSPVLGLASAVMIGHANGHELFSDPVSFSGADFPPLGTISLTFDAAAGLFDGWGYVRLLDSNPAGGFTEIDQLAIPETSDPAFATGFGDLTVHEVEVPRADPNEGGSHPDDGELAYFSWYSGGFRVAEYDATGITEVGHYIDPAGNNFWGVALAEDENGDRIVLASDRDFGLFIFRYTGP